MKKFTKPSNTLSIKFNQENQSLEIKWDRKPNNIGYVLNNLSLFNISISQKITKQLLDYSNQSQSTSKISTDIIFI
jgi:hypothetical protein